jgi:hypothetical protein
MTSSDSHVELADIRRSIENVRRLRLRTDAGRDTSETVEKLRPLCRFE